MKNGIKTTYNDGYVYVFGDINGNNELFDAVEYNMGVYDYEANVYKIPAGVISHWYWTVLKKYAETDIYHEFCVDEYGAIGCRIR